jgi:hypothetical protein
MRSLALALIFTALALSAAKADDSCKAQDRDKKFVGDMLESFMENCKTLAEMVCDARAIDKKLLAEAKDSFTKECVRDAVGSSR